MINFEALRKLVAVNFEFVNFLAVNRFSFFERGGFLILDELVII